MGSEIITDILEKLDTLMLPSKNNKADCENIAGTIEQLKRDLEARHKNYLTTVPSLIDFKKNDYDIILIVWEHFCLILGSLLVESEQWSTKKSKTYT